VIAIIATLIGLLLPAVQSARESARRTSCSNRIRQLAIGFTTYDNAKKQVPDAYSSSSGWSALVMVLPFIEEKGLYEQLSKNGPLKTTPRPTISIQPLLQASLPQFLCPSCASTPTNPNQGDLGTSHYAVSNAVFGPYLPGDETGYQPTHSAGKPYRLDRSQVSDGLSKTIMIGERALGSAPFASFGAAWPGRQGSNAGALGRGAWPPNTPFFGGTDGGYTRHSWTSYHPGGITIVMCDSATKFLSESIDSRTTYAAGPDTQTAQLLDAVRKGTMNRVYQNIYLRDDGLVVGDY